MRVDMDGWRMLMNVSRGPCLQGFLMAIKREVFDSIGFMVRARACGYPRIVAPALPGSSTWAAWLKKRHLDRLNPCTCLDTLRLPRFDGCCSQGAALG